MNTRKATFFHLLLILLSTSWLFAEMAQGQVINRASMLKSMKVMIYHGKLVDPSSKAVDGSFKLSLKILSPDPSLCLLWSETQDVLVKNGGFSVEVGHEANRRPGNLGGVADDFTQVFLNNPSLVLPNATCAVGTSYVATADEDRLLQATFESATTEIAVAPIPIKAIPYALQAEQIGGYGLSNLMKISGAGSNVVMTPEETQSIKDFLGNDLHWNMKTRRITQLASPVDVTDAATKGWVETHLSGLGLGTGSVTNVTAAALPLSVANNTTSPVISIAQANTSTAGFLSAADWNLFNAKQSSVLSSGQILVGNAGNVATAVSPSGDISISNSGVTAIGASKVLSTMINDGEVGVSDLNFAGAMAINTGLLVRDGTQFFNKTCGANETLIWSVANGWSCNGLVLTESDPQVGANTTNYLSKWDGSALVASSVFESGGNVGIGTSSPIAKLSLLSQAPDTTNSGINVVISPSTTLSGSNWDTAQSLRVLTNIPSGVTNSGMLLGSVISVSRNLSNPGDSGSLNELVAQTINYGHANIDATATPSTTSAYGLFVRPYLRTGNITSMYDIYLASEGSGGTSTNRWGIYQANSANNYFAGNVGIGTTSPVAKLDISNGTTSLLRADTVNNGVLIGTSTVPTYNGWTPFLTLGANWGGIDQDSILLVGSNGAGKPAQIELQSDNGSNNPDIAHIRKEDSGNLIINNSGWNNPTTPHFVVSTAGNVGIGTTSPGEKLEVVGNVKATAFISTSDQRLKTNIQKLQGLNIIRQLNGYSYDWKSNGASDYGVLAQEVEKVMPAAVATGKDSGVKAVKYNNIIAPLIESVKEIDLRCQAHFDQQSAQIERLQKENEALNARLEKLEKLVQAIGTK